MEQILRKFLWSGLELYAHKAKVAWLDLSLPLEEGDLGIRKLKEWNIALMAKHLWNVCGLVVVRLGAKEPH